jgi:hemerythrin
VDYEHRELVRMINELHAQLASPGASEDAVDAFLGEINARISAHFALEEKEMRDRHYDALPAHKRDHERLLDEIRDLMDQYEDDERFDEQELARRLTDWFAVHFRTHDARLHRHLPHG